MNKRAKTRSSKSLGRGMQAQIKNRKTSRASRSLLRIRLVPHLNLTGQNLNRILPEFMSSGTASRQKL